MMVLTRFIRPALIAALLSAGIGPGVAQTTAVTPSLTASDALWCGAAFVVTGARLRDAGDAAAADAYAAKAETAFGIAATELIGAGMSVAAFKVLAGSYSDIVTAPFRDAPLSESRCDAIITPSP